MKEDNVQTEIRNDCKLESELNEVNEKKKEDIYIYIYERIIEMYYKRPCALKALIQRRVERCIVFYLIRTTFIRLDYRPKKVIE